MPPVPEHQKKSDDSDQTLNTFVEPNITSVESTTTSSDLSSLTQSRSDPSATAISESFHIENRDTNTVVHNPSFCHDPTQTAIEPNGGFDSRLDDESLSDSTCERTAVEVSEFAELRTIVEGDTNSVSPVDQDHTVRWTADEFLKVTADPEKTFAITPEEASRLADPLATINDGDRLGHFRLIRVLGKGSYGKVYLAIDPQLDRKVAIKVSRRSRDTRREDDDRFVREARAAAHLRHPHIVPVYEMGILNESHFIAYEYIQGETLSQFIAQNKTIPERLAAELFQKLAAALHYAHSQGIVHRDMKPDNVLLDERHEPHIADFGLAKRIDVEVTATIEGAFLGTPCYTSPEQASGRAFEADGRADIWSLGVMLYESLTGIRPFRGSLTDVLHAVRTLEPPPIRQLNDSLPKDLETICQKCMAKSPSERFATAGELAEELARYCRGEPIHSRPLSFAARALRWSQRNPVIAGLIGAVALSLILGTTISSYFAYVANSRATLLLAEKSQRTAAQVVALDSAQISDLPPVIEALVPARDDIGARLKDRIKNSETTSPRDALVLSRLYPDSPEITLWMERVISIIPTAKPAELQAIGEILAPLNAQVTTLLWPIAEDVERSPASRLRGASLLAAFAPTSNRWPAIAPDLAAAMTSEHPFTLGEWIDLFRPIRHELELPLEKLMRQSTSDELRRTSVAILSSFFADSPDKLVSWLEKATVNELPSLLQAGRSLSGRLTELIDSRLQSLPETEWQGRVNLTLTGISLGSNESSWRYLRESEDETVRVETILNAASAGVDWRRFAERLHVDQDPHVLAAIILALGKYSPSQLIPSDRETMGQQLQTLFATHPSAAVHAATRRTLMVWGEREWLNDNELKLRTDAPREGFQWHVDPMGYTFVVFDPVNRFTMGAAKNDPHQSPYEHRHTRQIPRRFGLGMFEVTARQFLELVPEHEQFLDSSPESDGPVNNLNWFEACIFCRKLSERAQFPKEQICFPETSDIREGILLDSSVLDRYGYRLPTAGEWEYAARGLNRSSYICGNPQRIAEFAWMKDNSGEKMHRVGSLFPNIHGLFDVHGNASEWCLNWYFDHYGNADSDGHIVDGLESRRGGNREIRGGNYRDPTVILRCSDRDRDSPLAKSYVLGIRLARTYPKQ